MSSKSTVIFTCSFLSKDECRACFLRQPKDGRVDSQKIFERGKLGTEWVCQERRRDNKNRRRCPYDHSENDELLRHRRQECVRLGWR